MPSQFATLSIAQRLLIGVVACTKFATRLHVAFGRPRNATENVSLESVFNGSDVAIPRLCHHGSAHERAFRKARFKALLQVAYVFGETEAKEMN